MCGNVIRIFTKCPNYEKKMDIVIRLSRFAKKQNMFILRRANVMWISLGIGMGFFTRSLQIFFNVKYNFMMPKGASAASDLVNRALSALQKNRNNYLGNMKVMYTIMDHNFLGNLSLETTAKLQDAIRSVPNHLWVFKLRSMIYMWYNYSQVIKTNNTGDGMYQAVLKQWKSPVIHWLAKQAFMELKSISKLEFPQFSEIFGRASNGGNGKE